MWILKPWQQLTSVIAHHDAHPLLVVHRPCRIPAPAVSILSMRLVSQLRLARQNPCVVRKLNFGKQPS
jgi:hypothetical protein